MFSRLLLVLAGSASVFVLVELGLRAYDALPVGRPLASEQEPTLRLALPWGWGFTPNARRQRSSPDPEIGKYELVINGLGLADREYAREKPEGTFRILLLGDSFGAESNGVPLAHMYHELAERALNESGDIPTEIVNSSVFGWSTDQQAIYYEQEGRHFGADLVLLAFFIGNDVMGNHERFSASNKPTFGIREEGVVQLIFPERNTAKQERVAGDFEQAAEDYDVSRATSFRLRHWARENLRLFWYLKRAAMRSPLINRMLIRAGMREKIRHVHQIYLVDEPIHAREAWIVTKYLLLRLKTEVQRDGAEFAVLVIPPAPQLEPQYWWDPQFEMFPAMADMEWDLGRPSEILQKFLKENQIPFYFFHEDLAARAKQADQRVSWLNDGHWNITGHAFAGDLTAEWLLKSGLLPQN